MKSFFYTIFSLSILLCGYLSLGTNSVPMQAALKKVEKSEDNGEKKVHVVDGKSTRKRTSKPGKSNMQKARKPGTIGQGKASIITNHQADAKPDQEEQSVKIQQVIATPEPSVMDVAKDLATSNKVSREVIGDSRDPLIDLASVTTVNPMELAEGDPADLLPWKTSEYYHFAKNQELKELVRNFCTMQSMDVIVSDSVTDIVNGKFSNISPRQCWKDIVNAYGLVWFFDGSMMYVYKSSEVRSNVYQMTRDEMRTLVKVIAQLGFLSSNVNFRPLETSGILVVSGPPKLMSLIEELSKKVVVERVSDVYDIRSFPLKHAWAYDMSVNYRGGTMNIPGVATMLQQIVGALPGPVGDSNMGININNSKSNEAIPQTGVAGTAMKKSQQEAPIPTKPQEMGDKTNPVMLGNIFITYDTRLNAVIVKAKHQDIYFIEGIINQLDVPRDAIKIDVAVVDITKAGALKIGSQFKVMKGDKDRVNVNYQALNATAKMSSSITLNFGKLFRGYSLQETLDFLEDVGDAQTLTRSSVITLDNIGAVIDRSSTVYVAVKGNESESLYDVTVSTKLVVVPHIIPGEFDKRGAPRIKLLIEVTDGNFDQDPRTDAKEPKTATNSVNTEASIYEGQSLFIGGYFHESHSTSSAGVPLLKDLPWIGNLFKMQAKDNSVMERIYIITPTLVSSDDPKNEQLNRFFTDSQLSGQPTLEPDDFILTHEYKKPSFDNATFKESSQSIDWRVPFKKNISDKQDPKLKKSLEKKSKMAERRRR